MGAGGQVWQKMYFSYAAGVALLALTACARPDKADGEIPDGGAGRLVLAVESAETSSDGRRCVLGVTATNHTGEAALNVQAAWMAQTEGSGSISDFQMLGDFAVGEERPLQLGIFGAPCDAVKDVKLTRAVCTLDRGENPPESCADRVVLEGRGDAGKRLISR